MIAKSRFTASSSKPVPEPTVKTEFESVGEAADTDAAAAKEETRGEARALEGPVGVADTGAAAEEDTCGEARALGDPIEAADTDAVAAEEETCGEARALGGPDDAADTDAAAAEEETCGEARALEGPVGVADTDVAAADLSPDKGCRTLRNSRRSHRCAPFASSKQSAQKLGCLKSSGYC